MEIIAPLVLTIQLLVPPASKGIHWDVNEVHNQVQITFRSGVQASYQSTQVPCNTEALKDGFTLYHTKGTGRRSCYLVDTSRPVMVRSPWLPTSIKTYNNNNR